MAVLPEATCPAVAPEDLPQALVERAAEALEPSATLSTDTVKLGRPRLEGLPDDPIERHRALQRKLDKKPENLQKRKEYWRKNSKELIAKKKERLAALSEEEKEKRRKANLANVNRWRARKKAEAAGNSQPPVAGPCT